MKLKISAQRETLEHLKDRAFGWSLFDWEGSGNLNKPVFKSPGLWREMLYSIKVIDKHGFASPPQTLSVGTVKQCPFTQVRR